MPINLTSIPVAGSGTLGGAIPNSGLLIAASDGANLQQLLVESAANRNLRAAIFNGANEWGVDASGFGAIKSADGALATIGAKADAADTTSTNTDSLMAFIKGLVKLLNSATGAAVPTNADYFGLNANNALPAAATIGNLVGALGDKFGRQVTLLNAFRDIVTPITRLTLTASTTETTLISAVASVFLDIVSLVIINTSATVCQVDFRDSTAGTIRSSHLIPPTDERGVVIPVPLPQATVNNNWTAQCGTSVSSIIITGHYIQNK